MDPHPVLEASFAAAGAEPGLWQMAGSLAVVLGLVFVSAHLVRRLLGARLSLGQAGARLRLAQTLPLGGKRFLSLVEVDGQGLLLAISGDRIELLHLLEGDKPLAMPAELGS
jgi:flagellar biogenesis protein FliO